ncbi:hypothetical protein ABZS81_23385 [Streptomyces sp. NPDC005318]|uniref:hypothetical protein n=1 Tax=Streptomyces sp. NPDC005318 TaxID=3157031 RepID=UPI0033BB39F3
MNDADINAASMKVPVTVSNIKRGLPGSQTLSVEAGDLYHDPGHPPGARFMVSLPAG